MIFDRKSHRFLDVHIFKESCHGDSIIMMNCVIILINIIA